MKNDQLEIASNCEEKEGYICQDAQDPFDIDEYTETHTIQVRQRRTKVKKIKAPKGLENILYNIYVLKKLLPLSMS